MKRPNAASTPHETPMSWRENPPSFFDTHRDLYVIHRGTTVVESVDFVSFVYKAHSCSQVERQLPAEPDPVGYADFVTRFCR